MKRISVALLVLCVCFAPTVRAQNFNCTAPVNWTEFHTIDMARYNPCETVLNVENVGSLQVKWSARSRNYRVESSPAVVNGVVYVGSTKDRLYALKASTGALLWTFAARD